MVFFYFEIFVLQLTRDLLESLESMELTDNLVSL